MKADRRRKKEKRRRKKKGRKGRKQGGTGVPGPLRKYDDGFVDLRWSDDEWMKNENEKVKENESPEVIDTEKIEFERSLNKELRIENRGLKEDKKYLDVFVTKLKRSLSNKEKDKINHLSSIFSEDPKKDFFSKQNLSKILQKKGKENLIDILDYKILTTKKNKDYFIDLKKYFIEFKIPIMPVKAKDLIEKFDLEEGKLLGSILKEIEDQWLNNNFKISNNQIEDIVKSKRI